MKNVSFSTIGIGILIVLNLVTVGYLFSMHPKKNSCNKRMSMHGKHHFDNHHHKSKKDGKKEFHKRDSFGYSPMKHLGLAPEQKEKMETLGKERKRQMESVRKNMRSIQEKKENILKDGTVDKTQITSLANEYGAYQKELYLLRLNHKLAINDILTDEQKAKLENLRNKRRNNKYQGGHTH